MSDTESFESVMEAAMPLLSGDCVFESCPDENDDCMHCAIHMADRLRRAYDREIRDTAQQEYHRGFEAGRHSMDAEHRAVSMRLRGLRFDGGSHENLARIAYAIYPCATGWTCESAAGLRDKLIDLMGGVSDDTSIGAGGGACAADDCDCAGEQKEIEHGGAAHDSVSDSRGGAGSELVHMAGVTYDPLWNERHEAVRVLRKLLDRNTSIWNTEISIALGLNIFANNAAVCRRLIHLLGGNKPSGIDVLRAMDAESGTDVTSPNDVLTSSITDELRKWASDRHCKGLSHTDVLNIGLIADRIDEQHDRICQQQEDVLQSTIDGMVKEYEHDRMHVELPKDANGKVFRIGCTVRMVERHPEVLLAVHSMTMCDDGEWRLCAWDDKDKYSCNLSTLEFEVCEPKPDNAESIVRDLSIGSITESEAVERIEALNG